MRWKVMISAPYMQPVAERFEPLFRQHGIELFVPKVRERMEEKELLAVIADIDGVICGDDRFTRKVLAQAKKLKVISKWGTGIDSIDKKEARKLGIAVCNTPNAFTAPVADTTFAYILSFARRIPWATGDMRQGKWKKQKGSALQESTLGVIGVGNIGRAVVKRAAAFGMQMLGHDPKPVPANFLKRTGLKMVSRGRLLRGADYVSINCDLNPTSYHLIGHEQLNLMKSSAYLINTARGPIVDEKALIEALQKKKIAGAALDVYEKEPLPAGSPLRKMPNCLLSSHDANSSPTAWEQVHQNTIRNLLRELYKHQEAEKN